MQKKKKKKNDYAKLQEKERKFENELKKYLKKNKKFGEFKNPDITYRGEILLTITFQK